MVYHNLVCHFGDPHCILTILSITQSGGHGRFSSRILRERCRAQKPFWPKAPDRRYRMGCSSVSRFGSPNRVGVVLRLWGALCGSSSTSWKYLMCRFPADG